MLSAPSSFSPQKLVLGIYSREHVWQLSVQVQNICKLTVSAPCSNSKTSLEQMLLVINKTSS